MRRLWMCMLAVGVALATASMAGAFTVPPSAPQGTEGEVRLLWTEPVEPTDVGKTCEVVVVSTNNVSTREGSDLIVGSGGATLVVQNVEHDTSPETVAGELTLGPTITVSVRFGPDGEFSGGASVNTTCPPTGVPTPTVLPVPGPAVLPETVTAPPAGASPPAAAAVPAQARFTG